MPYKKLIESVMPVKAINGESEREKTARSGLPNSVHIWWSRRPMAAARSTLARIQFISGRPAHEPNCRLTSDPAGVRTPAGQLYRRKNKNTQEAKNENNRYLQSKRRRR